MNGHMWTDTARTTTIKAVATLGMEALMVVEATALVGLGARHEISRHEISHPPSLTSCFLRPQPILARGCLQATRTPRKTSMTSTPILRAATPTLPASSSAVRRSLQRGARAFHWKPTPSVPPQRNSHSNSEPEATAVHEA